MNWDFVVGVVIGNVGMTLAMVWWHERKMRRDFERDVVNNPDGLAAWIEQRAKQLRARQP